MFKSILKNKHSVKFVYFFSGLFLALSIYAAFAALPTVISGQSLTATAWNHLVNEVNTLSGGVNTPVYKCPVDTSTTCGVAMWHSYGCIGQLSLQSTCSNYSWPNLATTLCVKNVNCTLVGNMKIY